MPHYHPDPNMNPYNYKQRHFGNLIYKYDIRGIRIFRIFMPPKSNKMVSRVFSWLWFNIMSLLIGMFLTLKEKPDIIFTPSPPLTNGIVAWLLSLLNGAKYIYNVQEIYPDIAINSGILKDSLVISILKKIELLVYKKAHKITVISKGMRNNLIGKGIKADKIEYIPNFVDINEMELISRVNPFSIKYSISDKFVVSYAGNVSVPQNLWSLISAAKILKNIKEIVFMIIGEGMQLESLKNYVEKSGLNNFLFLPFQSYALVPQIYASSDLNLVMLSSSLKNDAIPSKVYRIMACKRAVLAIAPLSSDLAGLIREANCGFIVSPEDEIGLAKIIHWSYENKEKLSLFSESGRKYILEHYTRETITRKYKHLIDLSVIDKE
jgi:colanic acid biosynthesis glycosyl transferase WcaI